MALAPAASTIAAISTGLGCRISFACRRFHYAQEKLFRGEGLFLFVELV